MKRWSFISRTARSMIQTCEIVIGISCEVWHELFPGGTFLSQVNLWFQTTCKINESMSCFQQVSVSLYFNDLFAYLFPALEPSSIACFFSGHREGRVSRVRPIFGFQNLFNFLHTLIRWGQQTTDLIGPTFGHHRPLSNLCLRVAMILQDLHEALQATKMCDVSKLMNSSFALVLFWPTFKLKLSAILPFSGGLCLRRWKRKRSTLLCLGGCWVLVRLVRRCSLGETDPKPIGHRVPRCRATPKADGGTRRGCHRKVEVPSKDIVETRWITLWTWNALIYGILWSKRRDVHT